MSDCPGWRLIRCHVARPSKKRMVVLPLPLRSSRRSDLRRAEFRGPWGREKFGTPGGTGGTGLPVCPWLHWGVNWDVAPLLSQLGRRVRVGVGKGSTTGTSRPWGRNWDVAFSGGDYSWFVCLFVEGYFFFYETDDVTFLSD